MIKRTCSETCCTFSMPLRLAVFDLFPISYQDSIPGSTALKPLRFKRRRCASDKSERLLSAMKSMLSGGAAASIASSVSSKRTPKFGSCQATRGRFIVRNKKRRSSLSTSRSSGWYGTVESMQKLQVYGHPRLASIGTIVRTAQNGHRSEGAESVAQRIRQQRGFGERADEDQIDLARQLLREVFQPGVAEEADLVTLGLAPGRDHLRHDARHVGVHRAGVDGPGGAPGDQIDDRHSQPPHEVIPSAAWDERGLYG